ncbi:hypothetical protein ThvES_00019650 [Thiovulum sp. ES]|nr:hypothetical protein ThvES_00019650 [Thiovulum sp. ES]
MTEQMTHLNKIKDSLISAVHSGDKSNELYLKVVSLLKDYPEHSDILDIILLLNSNLNTDNTRFRTVIVNAIRDMISIKLNSMQVITDLSDRVDKLEHAKSITTIKGDSCELPSSTQDIGKSIPTSGTHFTVLVHTVLKAFTENKHVFMGTVTFVTLYVAYSFNPSATDHVIGLIKSLLTGNHNVE